MKTVKHKAALSAAVGLAVLAGAAGWGVDALGDADRTAETRYWTAAGVRPDTDPDPAAVPSNELSALLLPRGDTFRPGPDVGDQGDDYSLSAELALERLKENRKGLSAAERKQRDGYLSRLRLQGMAGRTYQGEGFGAEIRVTRAEGKDLANYARLAGRLLKVVGDDTKPPKIKGHPGAACALREVTDPEEAKKDERVETLACVAYSDGVLVTLRGYGPRPLGRNDALLELFKAQLDHLKSPGESV
ncbi:hypothetical protein [Streptomyces sp. NPDC097619]|uniref:hypothetical protein n=1 Tax=Streptomyces sp. NPDC097619 TaxID=3157228 RepID=UPI00332AC816